MRRQPLAAGPSARPSRPRRSRIVAAALVAAGLLASIAPPALARTFHWIGTSGGSWSEDAKWSLGFPPSLATDSVYIDAPGTYVVNLGYSRNLSQLSIGGASGRQTLVMNGVTLTLRRNFTVAAGGELRLGSDNDLTPTLASNVNGLLRVEGSNNYINQLCYVQSTGRLEVAPTSTLGAHVYVYQLFNHGSIVLAPDQATTGSAQLAAERLTNAIDGTLAFSAGATAGRRILDGDLDNFGTVTIDTETWWSGLNHHYNNSAAISILGPTGSLHVEHKTYGKSALANYTGGVIRQTNGAAVTIVTLPLATSTFYNGGTWTADGDLTLGQGTSASIATLAGTIALADGRTFAVTGGKVAWSTNAVTGAAGRVTLTNCTVTSNLSITAGLPAMTVTSGDTLAKLSITSGGLLSITGGGNTCAMLDVAHGGTLHLAPVTTLEAQLTLTGNATNHGTIELGQDRTPNGVGARLATTGATLTNADDGVIDVLLGRDRRGARTYSGALVNRGLVRNAVPVVFESANLINEGTGTLELADSLTVTGTSFVNRGLMRLAAPARLAVASAVNDTSGTIATGQPLTLTGSTLVNRGTLAAGGGPQPFTLVGAMTNDTVGTVRVDIGAPPAAAAASQLIVTGATTLDGTLRVALANSFVPAAGDLYVVLKRPAATSALRWFPDRTLPDGLEWRWRPYADHVTVVAQLAQPNTPPVAVEDTASVLEDSSVVVRTIENDFDVDGDRVLWRADGLVGPKHGTWTEQVGHRFLYRPAPDYFGADTMGYLIADDRGATTVGRVRVRITPVDDPPRFVAPTPAPNAVLVIGPGQTLRFDVVAADPEPGDIVELDARMLPAGAVVTPDVSVYGNPATIHFEWTPTIVGSYTRYADFRLLGRSWSDYREFILVVDSATPVLDLGFRCGVESDSVTLHWNSAAGEERLERAEDAVGPWAEPEGLVVKREASTARAVDVSAEPGRHYAYRLVVAEGGGLARIVGPLELDVPIAIRAVDVRSRSGNPANGRFALECDLVREGPARLDVLDVQGRAIARLASGTLAAGRHRIEWDTRTVAPGLYFIRLETAGTTRTLRVTVQH